MPVIRDAGECALLVRFGDRSDAGVGARVLALDVALSAEALAGLVECVPAYAALMVHYDPLILPRAALLARVETALLRPVGDAAGGETWLLPACADPALAEDLGHVAEATGLSPARVTALHLGATYRVCMYGFAPGWAYLDGLPEALALPRRPRPRDLIPAGSLIVAGGQAIVAGGAMPSGWHILGRTPERMFAPGRDPVVLMAPGDWLRFDPVDLTTFHALEAEAAAGRVLARRVPG
ncbi:MAG: 5-oxoprolinase subunit B family protein [Gemmobacter sp.]